MSDERSDTTQSTQFHYHLELTPAQLRKLIDAADSEFDDHITAIDVSPLS